MNKKGKIIGLALIAIMVVSLFIAVMPSIVGKEVTGSAPDLIIQDKWETIDSGTDTYQVYYTINNTGNATAPKCHWTTLYVDGEVEDHHFVPVVLGINESKTYTFGKVLTCTPGTHNITVCADDYDSIDELNETNNCLTNELKCKPDLIIEDKTEIPETCTDTYTVQYTVKNIGNATAPACHYATLYVDKEFIEHKMVTEDLKPCGTHTGTFDTVITCSPGEHNITVCADDFNTVAEWNETNNCKTNNLTCKPDLVVEKEIKWKPCDKEFYVEYTIMNIGNATAPAGHNTTLYLDGAVKEHHLVPDDLEPCENKTYRFEAQIECTSGEHNVTVCADDYNIVDEWNEDNNCDINLFECKPDLVIEDKQEEFEEEDGKYKVTYTIKNKGNATAPAGHTARLKVDGKIIENQSVPVDLKPCQSETYTFTTDIVCTPPKDTIEVCADACDIVTEWNETNNCKENTLICGPDLEVTDKWEEMDPVNEGQYRVHYTIYNAGSTTAPAGHTTKLYVENELVCEDLVPTPLKPCKTYDGTFDCIINCTPPGNNITVCADKCNVIEEVNETNNCMTNYLECGPDLVVIEKHEEWVNDTHYNVSFTIRNQGDMTAHYPFWNGLLVFNGDYAGEGGTVVGDLQVQGDGLAPGETWTATFDDAIECTPLFDTIIVYVDCFDEVVETNEENNWLENVWHCGPDLVITDKEEEWVQAGGNYIVHYTIKNIGNMTAPAGHDTTLKVDGVDVDHKEVPVALKPGETHTDTFDAVIMITRPSDTIEVCADNFDEVLELDEENNCLENEWAYDEKPDLVIKKIWEKDSRRGTYKVKFEIKNLGTAPTPRRVRHYVNLSVDGVEIEKKAIRTTLEPGEIYKSHFRARITCSGDFDTIRVCADKYNVIDELNEENNCLEKIHPC